MKQPVGCIAALLALAAGVAITAPGQASSAPPVNELTWWALGDSYSAGEGLQTVDHEVNPPGVLCERASGTSASGVASRAYAVVARDTLAGSGETFENFSLKACTGAITNQWREQWEETGSRRADVITLSMGGNNIGFADVVLDCVGVSLEGGAAFASGARAGVVTGALSWALNPSLGCNTSEQELRSRIDMLVGKGPDPHTAFANSQTLPDMYRELAEQAVRPGGHVFVLGYPNLVETSGKWTWRLVSGNRCHRLRRADANMLRSATGYLNEQIALAVQAADQQYRGVHFHWMDVSQVYENDTTGHHGLCTGQPWLNGLTVGSAGPDAGLIPIRVFRSFHPNQLGQDATGTKLAADMANVDWSTLDVASLTGHGIGATSFGDEAESVVRQLTAVLGPPTEDLGWEPTGYDPASQDDQCRSPFMRVVHWEGLRVILADYDPVAGAVSDQRKFVAYSYGDFESDRDPLDLITDRGLALGDSEAEARALYPDARFESQWIYEQGVIEGYLSDSGDLRTLFAGTDMCPV